jgi:hypothetical protein
MFYILIVVIVETADEIQETNPFHCDEVRLPVSVCLSVSVSVCLCLSVSVSVYGTKPRCPQPLTCTTARMCIVGIRQPRTLSGHSNRDLRVHLPFQLPVDSQRFPRVLCKHCAGDAGARLTLSHQDRKQVLRLVDWSMWSSAALYVLFGLLGYLAFAQAAEGNVLINITSQNTAMMLARLGEHLRHARVSDDEADNVSRSTMVHDGDVVPAARPYVHPRVLGTCVPISGAHVARARA